MGSVRDYQIEYLFKIRKITFERIAELRWQSLLPELCFQYNVQKRHYYYWQKNLGVNFGILALTYAMKKICWQQKVLSWYAWRQFLNRQIWKADLVLIKWQVASDIFPKNTIWKKLPTIIQWEYAENCETETVLIYSWNFFISYITA